jgi:DNA-binding GntR family transcriptional regulator
MGRSDSPQEQERLNFEFHRIINTACGSRRISSLLKMLTRSLPMHYFEFVPEWPEQALHQHADIIDAFRRRDPAAAQRAMEQHLFASARHAVAALERLDFFDDAPPNP